jgi:hypothetical protein
VYVLDVWPRVSVLILALLAVAAASCRQAPLLLFYLDPYTAALWADQGLDRRGLQGAFGEEARVALEIQQPGTAQQQGFLALLQRDRPRMVYLSSLFGFDPAAAASANPGMLLVQEGEEAPQLPNELTLRYQRCEAFRQAGELAARLLSDPQFLERVGGSIPTGMEARAGILATVVNGQVGEQLEAFRSGFALRADPAALEYMEVGNASDRVRARQLLERMRERGVVLFLLKTYGLSGFCLELLQKQGGVAITEAAVADRAYGDVVLLTLQEDLPRAMSALKGRLEGGGVGEVVEAPLRLAWGEGFSWLPAEWLPDQAGAGAGPGGETGEGLRPSP